MSENDTSRIVINNSRVMLTIVVSLTDNSRGSIHNCNVFIDKDAAFSNFKSPSGQYYKTFYA